MGTKGEVAMSDSVPLESTPAPDDERRRAEALKQIEEAARKANSEAGFAFNAKAMAEEHARAVSEMKGRVEADVGWFTVTRQGAEQVQAAVSTAKAQVEADQRLTTDAASEATRASAAIKTASDQVSALRQETQEFRDAAASAAKVATDQATATTQFLQTAESSAKQLGELLVQAKGQAAEIQSSLATVTEARELVKGLVEKMTTAETLAASTLEIVQRHESELNRLKTECHAMHERIESLLPNATSAGLASAFRIQKARFTLPQRFWLATFVATILGLLASSLVGLPATDTWEGILRHFVNRLPLIAPLVWLAVYAGRHHGLALRLQEEYAYKEAVSTSFEGYKREMADIGATSPEALNPLMTLCDNVLRTLGQRPGRIYEDKPQDITPFTPMANAIQDGVASTASLVKAAAAPLAKATAPAAGGE
jgi:hypothetical protein